METSMDALKSDFVAFPDITTDTEPKKKQSKSVFATISNALGLNDATTLSSSEMNHRQKLGYTLLED